MSSKTGKSLWIFSVLYACIIGYQSYFVQREEFTLFISVCFSLFAVYLFLLKSSEFHTEKIYRLCILFYLIPLFASPSLSNDYARFLWDGELLNMGINPYDFKPNELINLSSFQRSDYLQNLYFEMGNLSQENYSCYPIFNQFYFAVATFFFDNLFVNIILLRLLIITTLCIGVNYLQRILILLQIEKRKGLLFALNPLLLIEVSQNLHFEGVMLSFLILAFYFLLKEKYWMSALFFMMAIQIKLIPLILIPFLLRYLGWRRTILIWGMIGITGILASLLLLDQFNYLHFWGSIKLYFRQFEFNSCILHWYIVYGEWKYGYNRIQTFGPYLSRIAVEIIIVLAWFGNHFSFQKMVQRMFFAMIVYYLFSSTVHPWYILTPLLLGIFTPFRFIQVWSAVIFLTYYSYSGKDEVTLRMLFSIEYLIVFFYFIYEVWNRYNRNLQKDRLAL